MVTVCPGRRLRVRSVLLLLLTALCLTGFSSAQTLKVNNPGTGSVPLDGNWRFHLGDDKAWADPALDDSGWETIRVDKPGENRAIRVTPASRGTGSGSRLTIRVPREQRTWRC